MLKYRFLLILTAAIWGFAFVAQTVAMDDIGPLTFSACRSFVGAASLLPVLLRHTPAPPLRPWAFSKSAAVFIAGCFLCGGTVFQQIGLVYTTASKASFITATYILLVPLFGLFFGSILRRNHVIGAVLAMSGVYFLTVTESFTIGAGDALIFLCALCFTGHILYLDYASQRYDPVEIAAGQFFVCGCLSLAGALLFETIRWDAILAAGPSILYVGVLSSGVAYTLQIIGQRHLPPTECSMLLSLEMVFGGLSGVLVLGESMTARECLGVVLMTLGIFWSQLPSRPVLHLSGIRFPRLSH